MYAYEIIKDGLNNEDDDSKIIDQLQDEYPTSRIENNIFILEETKSILESPPKPIPTEMKSNHFLIKSGKIFIDIDDGRLFNEYKEKTYANCNHGLCKKLGTLVLKNTVKNKDAYIPNVLIATNEKPKENKPIRIKYQNENKKQQVWEFTSQEINEAILGIDEGLERGLSDKQLNKYLAIKLFCPRECVSGLIKYIDINRKMERKRNNGISKSKSKTRMGQRGTTRKARR